MTAPPTTNQEALRELALAAEAVAPSPWRFDGRDLFCHRPGAEPYHLLIPLPETWHESQRVPDEVARFIAAASPSVILALLGNGAA